MHKEILGLNNLQYLVSIPFEVGNFVGIKFGKFLNLVIWSLNQIKIT